MESDSMVPEMSSVAYSGTRHTPLSWRSPDSSGLTLPVAPALGILLVSLKNSSI